MTRAIQSRDSASADVHTDHLTRFSVAFGPEMPGWGSWDWCGADVADQLRSWLDVRTFRLGEKPDADVVVIIKHPVPALMHASPRQQVVYAPVDFFGSQEEIDELSTVWQRCSRIVVHSESLRASFARHAPVEYVDHHLKYVSSSDRPNEDGPILWVGVRSNLPPLVDWVNRHGLPAPLVVLTNPERPAQVPSKLEIGLRSDRDVLIEEWSPERHLAWLPQCRAAFDVKANDFRSRHKPPTKAMDFLGSGIPFAAPRGSSSTLHLARMGFDVPVPLDVERWLSREYREETRRFGAALRELLSRERVGRRWLSLLHDVHSRNRS